MNYFSSTDETASVNKVFISRGQVKLKGAVGAISVVSHRTRVSRIRLPSVGTRRIHMDIVAT